jgi:hypothetical protein
MQLLIECGIPAIATWFASNVLFVIGWCLASAQRNRKIKRIYQPGIVLKMPRNLPDPHTGAGRLVGFHFE